MFRRALVVLILLNAVGFTLYSVIRYHRGDAAAEKNKAEVQSAATKFQNLKVMPQEEYLRLRTIGDAADSSGVISDADLDYLIKECQEPHTSSSKPGYIHFRAAAPFTCITKYGPGQKEKIMKAVVPLIRSRDGQDQRVGLDVAAHLHDARAVADAIALVTSKDEYVRRDAHKYLEAVGYHSAH